MTNKINGIDVSEYFIEVVDEGGNTIDYKILPNSKRLLVERIFEQNQQLKRLQEENEGLKKQLEFSRTHKTELDAERIKYIQALEKIRGILNKECGVISNAKAVGIINEVFNDY